MRFQVPFRQGMHFIMNPGSQLSHPLADTLTMRSIGCKVVIARGTTMRVPQAGDLATEDTACQLDETVNFTPGMDR